MIPDKEITKIINDKKYYIVAGSFKSLENAENLVAKLNTKGYQPELFGTTPKGLHMVSYESYDSKQDASSALRKIMREANPSAWIIKY